MALGSYAVSIKNSAGQEYQFPVDTSFEPYRREAFRHRSIPAQRQSIMLTNITGEGTVSTEGLWRREQTDYSMGAGQAYLDRKGDSQESRFLSSKGIDVFGSTTNSSGTTPYPMQASLLPDTFVKANSLTSGLKMSRCGDYVVVASGSTVYIYTGGTSTSAWTNTGSGAANSLYNSSYTSFGTINDITTNDSYCFLATTTGIWFGQIASGTVQFYLYAAPDSNSSYSGGYDMVKWANDQLIASRYARLYAFLPRVASGSAGATPPYYGSPPSAADNNTPITIATGGTSNIITVTTSAPHSLVAGQTFQIQNSSAFTQFDAASLSGGIVTATSSWYSGSTPFSVGDNISVTFYFNNSAGGAGEIQYSKSENATITATSGNTISWATSVFTYNDITTVGFANGNATGDESAGFNNTTFTVLSVPSSTTFTFASPYSIAIVNGTIFTGGSVSSTNVPDVLYTHANPNWRWSDATGGMTQVYFSGYVKGNTDNYNGCIYRSDLPGASTTTSSNLGTVTSTSSVQPWILSSPIQALPMSPDEYPTCVQSYLNYIFIGTNRGIRMAQTLSIYDPTATATGDLKSGPLIPNGLQPVSSPVNSIVGDGRFVWFSWTNYDGSNSGLGKLDLSTYIAGDPLAPAYASDVMFPRGTINYIDWDPATNTPIAAVEGYGVYGVYASNTTGIWNVSRYVSSGSIKSAVFDYGIPDLKIPVYFDYNAVVTSGSISASVTLEPNSASPTSYSISSYTGGNTNEFPVNAPAGTKAQEFQVTLTINSGSSNTYSPVLRRWALKSWPAVVQGTQISVVLQLFSVNEVDGGENYFDPYFYFTWLENLRQTQDLVTYTEGPLSVTAVIDSIDWIPHKRRDTYNNGFEGDLVLDLKTIGAYNYATSTTV